MVPCMGQLGLLYQPLLCDEQGWYTREYLEYLDMRMSIIEQAIYLYKNV